MPGRVLILDESPDMRDLFCEVLAREGHDVRSAKGPNAIDDIRDFTPDIVLVDASLAAASPSAATSMNGSDTAQDGDIPALGDTIHSIWPDVEVVYLVDASRPETRRRLERGRLRHFDRPFQIEDLQDLVDGLVNRRTGAGRGKASR